jgi:2-dehydro-3-deoxyphosphogluconate aldolase / (4S)-4-hydroxy-2-oxoglutarate aldolase
VSGREVLQVILQARLVAIVRLDDLSAAHPLIASLLRGGVRAIELTLTNPEAPAAVQEALERFEEFHDGRAVLGIGSIRTLDESRIAMASGSQFLVSPISDQAIIESASEAGIPIIPGAFTPTEIVRATSWGAEVIKVFPARKLGPETIKDILAPMPYLQLMPTGGVDMTNIAEYLKAGAVAVGVGGQLIDRRRINESNWSSIEEVARSYATAAAREC